MERPEQHREQQAQLLRKVSLQERVLAASVLEPVRQTLDYRSDRFDVRPSQEVADEAEVAWLALVDALEQPWGRESPHPLVKPRRC